MRNYTYYVYFKNSANENHNLDYIAVFAGCERAAIILAQAQRINNCMHYDVDHIYKVD